MRRSLTSAVVAIILVLLTPTAGVAMGLSHPSGPSHRPAYSEARSHTVEDPYYPRKGDPGVDSLHYRLRLRWDPRTRTLHAATRLLFRATRAERTIRLDLGDPLRVGAVRLDGHRVGFRHPGKELVVRTGRLPGNTRHRLLVRYHGTPRPAAAPTRRSDIPHVGWTTTRRGDVWTMQEPFGAYTWYPVNDQPSDKAFYDVRLNVPKGQVGVFNGRLVHRHTRHHRTITEWHLGSPASSYLTTVAIGDYRRVRDRGPHGLSISYWVRPQDQRLLPLLRRTPSMIEWLEARLGRYPFHRIGVVVVPSPSAMETQTLVTMGRGLLHWGRRLFVADLLHEYSHQWYGDTVTPNNWRDLWLNESFAMYVQIRWEVGQGWTTMRWWRRYLRSVDQQLRRTDGPPGAYDRRNFGSDSVYYCGALMLDRLRGRLGDRVFADVLAAWPQHHRYANADRHRYVGWLDRVTGRSLDRFFHEWLTSPTTPS